MSRKIIIGIAALSLSFLAAPAAWAGSGKLTNIQICNNFPQTIYYAIAYQQVTGDWMTRGWLTIPTGRCAFFDSSLSLPEFYYRAESDEYRKNGHLVQENWSKGGNRSFCIDKNTQNTFNYWNADKSENCSGSVDQYQQFQYYSNNNSYSSDVDVSYTLTVDANAETTINFKPLK